MDVVSANEKVSLDRNDDVGDDDVCECDSANYELVDKVESDRRSHRSVLVCH